MKKLIALSFLLFTFWSSFCFSQSNSLSIESGNDLYRVCNNDGTLEVISCLSFLRGVIQGMTAVAFMNESDEFYEEQLGFNIPSSAEWGQIRDVVVNALRQNPELRQEEAVFLVWKALREAWPSN